LYQYETVSKPSLYTDQIKITCLFGLIFKYRLTKSFRDHSQYPYRHTVQIQDLLRDA